MENRRGFERLSIVGARWSWLSFALMFVGIGCAEGPPATSAARPAHATPRATATSAPSASPAGAGTLADHPYDASCGEQPGFPIIGSQVELRYTPIDFEPNQATLRTDPTTESALNMIRTVFKGWEMIGRIRVEAHTDPGGDEAANQALTERRARAVMQWLVDHGIDPRRIRAAGCGSRDPVAPSTTAEIKPSDRARLAFEDKLNERIEFDIEEVDGKPFEFATAPCAPNPARGCRERKRQRPPAPDTGTGAVKRPIY